MKARAATTAAIAEHVASLMPRAQVVCLPSTGWPTDARRDQAREPTPTRCNTPIHRCRAPTNGGRHDPFNGAVHRHRRLDGAPSTPWRPRLEGSGRAAPRDRSARRLTGGAASRTTPPATASTRPSTAPPGRSTAPRRSASTSDDLGIEIRAGVHTGECEVIDGKCGGIAVTTGARIAALAEPSQVLVSQTVKDLVAGSGFTFEPAGEHELKGVPDRWRLFSAN